MKTKLVILLLVFCFDVFASEKLFLQKYCYDCHSNKKHKGGVNFEEMDKHDLLDAMEQLRFGDMPPKKHKLQPSKAEVTQFIKLAKATLSKQKIQTKYRWMMKEEHERTIRTFFGQSLFQSSLPKRFKNEFLMPDSQMDENHFSGAYLRNLIEDHKRVLDQLYPPKEHFNKQIKFDKNRKLSSIEQIIFANEVYEDGSALLRFSGPTLVWKAPYKGVYEISFSVKIKSAKFAGQDTVVISPVPASRKTRAVSKPANIKISGNQQKVTQSFKLDKGETLSIKLAHKPPSNNGVFIYKHKEYVEKIMTTGVIVSDISLLGPKSFDYSPWEKLFKFPKEKTKENISYWLQQLHPTRVDLNEFHYIYNEELSKTKSQDLAYKATLKQILNDYRFVLLDNYSDSRRVQLQRLYRQLTGNPPANGGVSYSQALKEILADTSFFSRQLANNWLATADIQTIDFSMYAGFSDRVRDHTKKALVSSMHSYLEDSIQKNLPIKSLLKSNNFISSQDLAQRHTDIPQPEKKKGLKKDEFKSVKAPPSRQYGLLTHPALHAAISNGNRRPNPIVRAAWIYKQILGKIPPEPPNVVPNIDPNVKGLKDIREIVNKHKSDRTCFNCHMKFDGLGFAFEKYDSLGIYTPNFTGQKIVKKFKQAQEARTEFKKYERDTHFLKGKNIYQITILDERDSSGHFYGGKVNGVESLSRYLTGPGYKTFKANVISRMCEQLLCRSLTAKERLSIQENLDRFSDNLKSLLNQLIISSLFRKNTI